MRILRYILFSAGLLTFTGCEKFLTTEPLNAVSDEATIIDKVSAETALRAVYRQFGNIGYYGENYVTFGYFPSGDIKNLTTGGAGNLVNANFRTDEVLFNTTWIAIYRAINSANHVITKVPSVNDPLLTDALKNQYVGEAKFLRALAYFDLARAWGGVQIILEPTTSLQNTPQVKRSTREQTYAQVLEDLKDAEILLPDVVNRVRATKRTVWALRARLHLYKEEWGLAETYATKLIEKTADYTLIKPFSNWFADNVKNTRESIFELQFSVNNVNSTRIQMAHSTNGGQYRYAPNDRFVQLLNDPTIGGGRKALITSVTQSGIVNWVGNLYYRRDATDPAYIFRIAEMYLIRAEARAEQDNLSATTGALFDLNQVRDRAELAPSNAVSKADVLLAIEEERRYEFAWEAHRWFDLARTGRAKAVLEALNPNITIGAHQNVFPIPVTQIQLDRDNLDQNPVY
ncbi:RagB/SusD family nutrient uptake outer membrane protein [Sphingobacterium corticibacterium]|uniref:RagB/SusD family nutrient uptake outer membrane protein n=1 Tax=Sphingobacterium corticibacterium TaxID=2484746 RepID=A0A4Q6XM80_9SPHI|nr:RagB/SusD family nutrient uptake outer membrane protein [Sphingobacterium corticibacterium]RZF58344.1 RagB/SusD family nutrient uptake outer membrane protein [Sphingobacterium corticibacterium]